MTSDELNKHEAGVMSRLDAIPKASAPQKKPSYFELVSLRIEASGRLARALFTLHSANVISMNLAHDSAEQEALTVAEKHWADICNGLVPVQDGTGTVKLRADLPACIEAFRIVVMECAQRAALDKECREKMAHGEGFKLLTQSTQLSLPVKHTCNEDCDHGTETI